MLCFHDFNVKNHNEVIQILEELKDLVGAPFSVLIIPDMSEASTRQKSSFFCAIKRLKEQGFEFALHGFKHNSEQKCKNFKGFIFNKLTHREAEFAGLSEQESAKLLQQAINAWGAIFKECFPEIPVTAPAAFVAPTWFGNKYLPSQVTNEHLIYESRFHLIKPNCKRYFSPVASFAGIPNYLLKPAIKFGETILKSPLGIPRIALHPTDFPKLNNIVKNLIRTALGNSRKLTLYRDL